ncbi:hypothetical protein AWC38_SpisGene15939 [Stylophora pistillata]|uniref:Uncharacterized protein n=1 Tax=Stylophora pistillata TaxID=50429 RepID=A0A2B4RTF7_STYPI|nr:hypothetical protein AWC38_SpisGene15939 [Stylophora pistillata]
MAAAHNLHCPDLEEFLDSMRQCFDEVEKELNDERNSIPLDYLESRLEDHFQVVHAIPIAIQNASDSRSDELKQLVEDLLLVSQSLLQEIHTTKIQREINERRSPLVEKLVQEGGLEQWNFHGIRTAGYHSPMALWRPGTLQSMDDALLDGEPEYYGIDFESSVTEMDGDGDIVVPENQVQLTEQEMAVLKTHVPDPLEDDWNSGIDLFISVCDVVKSVNNMP